MQQPTSPALLFIPAPLPPLLRPPRPRPRLPPTPSRAPLRPRAPALAASQAPPRAPAPPPPAAPRRGAARGRLRLLLTSVALMLATAPGRAAALGLLGDLVARPLAARNPFFAGGALGSELLDALLTATDRDPAGTSLAEAARHAAEFVLQVAVNVLLVYTF